jgi:hypothetical protein
MNLERSMQELGVHILVDADGQVVRYLEPMCGVED